jgi:methionyl-tRNA formyltransferase
MVSTLVDLPMLRPVLQDDSEASYAPKIDKAEAKIDFSQTAEAIERQVRAFAPFPGAWFELDGERVKVLKAEMVDGNNVAGTILDEALTIACGSGALGLLRVQRAGKPVMDAADFLRGKAVPAGTKLA